MKTTIVCYTNCLAPKALVVKVVRDAMRTAEKNGWNMVLSSHLPILSSHEDCRSDFKSIRCDSPEDRDAVFLDTWSGKEIAPIGSSVNLVTGILKYSFESILSQITHAISRFPDTEAVVLWEHDVIYPQGYAESMVKALSKGDYAVYRDNVFLDDEGFFSTGMQFWYLSRYAARKSPLMECFGGKMESRDFENLEPVLDGLVGERGENFDSDSYKIVEGPPVIDVRHGANASGQIIVDRHSRKNSHWGKSDKYVKLIMDKDYIDYVTSKPEVGYGLFISSQKFLIC